MNIFVGKNVSLNKRIKIYNYPARTFGLTCVTGIGIAPMPAGNLFFYANRYNCIVCFYNHPRDGFVPGLMVKGKHLTHEVDFNINVYLFPLLNRLNGPCCRQGRSRRGGSEELAASEGPATAVLFVSSFKNPEYFLQMLLHIVRLRTPSPDGPRGCQ